MPSRSAWTAERLHELGPTTDLTTAAEILGISRSAAYKLARRGTFPVPLLRVGAICRVPAAPLLTAITSTPNSPPAIPPARAGGIDPAT